MHEVAVAAQIICLAEQELEKNHANVIEEIRLEIGQLSGIVAESLEFALEASKNETVLQYARIVIDEVQALARCHHCDATFQTDDFFAICPECNSIDLEIIAGRDLLLKSLTMR